MPETKTQLSVRQVSPSASIIDISGEITAASENALMDAYTQANQNEPKAVLLNFEEMEYMNSSGIGLLVTLLIRANRQGQRILAVGLNEHYQHIFQLTRLDEAIQIFESEREALASVR